MKRNLKAILIRILVILVSCASYKYVTYNQFDSYVSKQQVDSICISERIPLVGDAWKSSGFVDSETQTPIKQYFYIIDKDTMNVVYTVTDLDSIYRFKKRPTNKVRK